MSNDDVNILLIIIFGAVVVIGHQPDRKAVILAIALQFSNEFGTPELEYRLGDIDDFATVENNIVTIDEDLVKDMGYERLKTLVYHTSGVAVGMPLSEGKDFMNPDNILKRYKRLKEYETQRLQVPN